MTMVKSLLEIVVDGRPYLWDAVGTSSGYVVTVRAAECSGQILRIEGIPLLAQDMRSLSAEGDVENMVPEMIRAALRRNWRPLTGGLPDFML